MQALAEGAVTAFEGGLAGDAVGRGHGDAVGDHVDHAADRAGTVEQGGGALEHFHLTRGVRIDAHGMVLAQRGDVGRGEAVFLYPYPRTGLAPNHRPAHALTEIGRTDAGRIGQRRAQALAALAYQLGAGDHGGRLDGLAGVLIVEGQGLDRDGGQQRALCGAVAVSVVRALRLCEKRLPGAEQAHAGCGHEQACIFRVSHEKYSV